MGQTGYARQALIAWGIALTVTPAKAGAQRAVLGFRLRWDDGCCGTAGSKGRLQTARLRPYGKLVAARFDEVKASASGEGKDRFDDFPTGGLDLGQGVFQLCAVEHDQRAAVIAARGHLGAEETTI